MNDLIFSCTDTLQQPSTPVCATDYGERVGVIMFSKTEVETSGNVPSAVEFNVAHTAGTLVTIKGLSNGHRTFLSETEIEWHQKEWHDKKYKVDGKVLRIDEPIARLCETLNFYNELYFYFITDNNYCFGPYESGPNFTLIQSPGTRPYIKFEAEYYGVGIDYSRYDADYQNITSLFSYLMTEDNKHILTEDGKVIIF